MRVKRFVSLFLVLMLLIGTCAPVYADETIPGNAIASETGEILLSDGAAKVEKISDRFFYVI